MKAHELAEYLMKCPNLPVIINGWGSDEGGNYEVVGAFYTTDDVWENRVPVRERDVIALGYNNIVDGKECWEFRIPMIK